MHRQEAWARDRPQRTTLHLPPPGPQQPAAHLVPTGNLGEASPGRSTSATMRSLSSNRQRRRRSTPVMISTAAPVLCDALTNAAKIKTQIHRRKAAVTGWIRQNPIQRRDINGH
jgi:hypothetical protein